jgi:hypothetical protein
MNQSLKSKRDELAKEYCDEHTSFEHYGWIYLAGYDAAIQAVIELLGEFDEKSSIREMERCCSNIFDKDGNFQDELMRMAKFQHEQMLNKLRGES